MPKLWRWLRYDWPLHFLLGLLGWLPDNIIFLRLRGAVARPFLGTCGPNLRLGRRISFYNPSMVNIGRDVYIAFGCIFLADAQISVEDEVVFGPYCVLASANHTRLDHSYRFGPPYLAPIRIGRGSWLGAHVTVTAGSVVGSGSLVAAGAVVAGSFPANAMLGGLPARLIKTLD